MHLAVKITKREGTHRHSYERGNSQSFHFVQNNTTQKTEEKKCFQNPTMAEFILLFLYSTLKIKKKLPVMIISISAVQPSLE